MKYITHKRFKGKAICGDVNIPAMTACNEVNGIIFCNNKPICAITSENAHQFFAVNDDGLGMERGSLTQRSLKRLSPGSKNYDELWNKVWDDDLCSCYKRKEHADHWLWNHAFYNAPIDDLKHIARLVGA